MTSEYTPSYIDLNDPARSLDILESSELMIDAPRLDGVVRGVLDSHDLGRGHLPDGARVYRPGKDDVHLINHKRSARDPFDRVWVTQRFHEVTPEVIFATDATNARHAQMAPGTTERPVYTSEQTVGLSALVGLCAVASAQNMDHAVVMDGGTRVEDTDFSLGEDHDMDIVSQLRRATWAEHAHRDDRLSSVIRAAGEIATGRSLVVVASDFLEPLDSWKRDLTTLVDEGHDVLALKIESPANLQIHPAVARLNIGGRAVWADTPGLRETYARKAAEKHEAIDGAFSGLGVRKLTVSNADPRWADTLADQLAEA